MIKQFFKIESFESNFRSYLLAFVIFFLENAYKTQYLFFLHSLMKKVTYKF